MAGEPVNVNEFEELSRQALPNMYYDFFAGGAEDQYTLEENIEAFRRIIGAASCDVIALIFSEKTDFIKFWCLEAKFSWIQGLSFTCKAVRFIQTFALKREITEHMVRRAESNGFRAIILTTDTPALAMKAIEAGATGIIVSNHGARQLDYTPATISVLEEVVHVVQGKVPVLIEGGIRRGRDIFKALALGAKAVLIGRPVIYGLAAKGESGVKQVIEILKNELEQTIALAGCCTVADITRNYVKTEKERLLGRM
ncbi:hypothetical protein RDI58_009481 [Solanum bulbocastanum]|uniref:(S)-2-hydroxy-acid oxidase n=1 Tax=Solanum bulbocastanum TaxID=147425 RepID=A0AAN8U4K0_SOLBU